MADESYETSYSDLTLIDAVTGRHPVVRAKQGYQGYGSQPYAICRTQRRGTVYHEATWLPTGARAMFIGRRDATSFIKAHEEIAYGIRLRGVRRLVKRTPRSREVVPSYRR
jgi:hypothetical protein